RRALRLLDVWSLLPQINCKRCGEATCMAFAAALLQHRRTLVDCLPLRDDTSLSGQRASLEAML
ncbi:MAG: tRNA CCA-pyrophosphorylase, partial [Chloroflexi bacterium]|nr:tRNA CCA-pyrophosphorylase [Chloroflexota bacterium]